MRRSRRRNRNKRGSRARQHLETLLAWSRSAGVRVTISDKLASDESYCKGNKIEISKKLSPWRCVFILLHELGHWHQNRRPDKTLVTPGRGYDKISVRSLQCRSQVDRVQVVIDEIDAWCRGWKIARFLNLRLNRDQYDIFRASQLTTYFKWALKQWREEAPGVRETAEHG